MQDYRIEYNKYNRTHKISIIAYQGRTIPRSHKWYC